MQVRLYAIVLGTGRYDPASGEELEIYLDITTTSSGAEEILLRFPGARIKKLIATPEGVSRGRT